MEEVATVVAAAAEEEEEKDGSSDEKAGGFARKGRMAVALLKRGPWEGCHR